MRKLKTKTSGDVEIERRSGGTGCIMEDRDSSGLNKLHKRLKDWKVR